MMSNSFLVSVVMAAKNEGQEVYETVKSVLEAGDGNPIECIVVDDCSDDEDTIRILDTLIPSMELPKLTNVKIIRLQMPSGAGMARNIGIAAAIGRVVVSVDAHMRFPVGCFHEMGQFAIEHQCVVNPIVSSLHGGPQGLAGALNFHRDTKLGCEYGKVKDENGEIFTQPVLRTAVLGACYVFPREIFDRFTRWSSTLGIWGYEEPIIGAWCYYHDIPIYGYPKFVVRHLYRGEVGRKMIPWGAAPVSHLKLNQASGHFAIFEPETYYNVWRPKIIEGMTEEDVYFLTMLEQGKLFETGYWRKDKKHTDYEFFTRVLKVPAVATERKAVERVKTISVIMTARNEGDEVEKTIVSIVNSGQLRFEIVLVDDASEDNSIPDDFTLKISQNRKLVKYFRDDIGDRIKIIRHDTPIGVTQSRHEAIELATGEILCVVDAHQRVIEKYGVEELCMLANESNGLVIPAYCGLGNAGEPKRTYGAKFSVKPKWGLMNSHVTSLPEGYVKDQLVQRNAVIGCGYTLTRDTLAQLGGWPQLPGYWSYNEQSLGLYAYWHNVKLYNCPWITFEHLVKHGFAYDNPILGVWINGHICHYTNFDDEAYFNYFRPALLVHGYDVEVDNALKNEYVLAKREEIRRVKAENGKTDELFFKEVLGIDTWPPKWEDK